VLIHSITIRRCGFTRPVLGAGPGVWRQSSPGPKKKNMHLRAWLQGGAHWAAARLTLDGECVLPGLRVLRRLGLVIADYAGARTSSNERFVRHDNLGLTGLQVAVPVRLLAAQTAFYIRSARNRTATLAYRA